ncbi:MAG TPA: protein-L-isoaspartate(D-aspartate) O-methyltransferase [Phycisphaerae bacterium]|nr:protein-L-isoaspartate(D-aspartate) O-methyltransferase [Phycisphaerae bacterium]
MADSGKNASRRGKQVLAVVVIVLTVLLMVTWVTMNRREAQDTPGPGAVGRPFTLPASLPDLRAADGWSPPRFGARQRERDRMVQVIRDYGLTDAAILSAMAAVPRHEFVPSELAGSAYGDGPLPIGYAQTISQPYIVAKMTMELRLRRDSRVLEIGTGSGYQAAVLTEFTPHVCTIEIVKPLADHAAARLRRLGYSTVKTKMADGYFGWAAEAPFDAIIVTCAAGQIPPPLIKQLAPGGRMVIPVGSPLAIQSLMLVEKDAHGAVHSRSLMAVRFVPLVRGGG